jgi:hypothetical protein
MSWLARLGLHVLVGVTLAVLDRVFSDGKLKQGTWLVRRPHARKFAFAVAFEVALLVGVWLSGAPELLLGLALLLPNAAALIAGIDLAELGMRLVGRPAAARPVTRVEVLPPGSEQALPESQSAVDAEQVVDAPGHYEPEEARRNRTRDSLNDKLKGY